MLRLIKTFYVESVDVIVVQLAPVPRLEVCVSAAMRTVEMMNNYLKIVD